MREGRHWEGKLRTVRTCELLERTLILLRIHNARRIEWDGPICVLNDGRRPAWHKLGVEDSWLPAEVRQAASYLAHKLVCPRQGPQVGDPSE